MVAYSSAVGWFHQSLQVGRCRAPSNAINSAPKAARRRSHDDLRLRQLVAIVCSRRSEGWRKRPPASKSGEGVSSPRGRPRRAPSAPSREPPRGPTRPRRVALLAAVDSAIASSRAAGRVWRATSSREALLTDRWPVEAGTSCCQQRRLGMPELGVQGRLDGNLVKGCRVERLGPEAGVPDAARRARARPPCRCRTRSRPPHSVVRSAAQRADRVVHDGDRGRRAEPCPDLARVRIAVLAPSRARQAEHGALEPRRLGAYGSSAALIARDLVVGSPRAGLDVVVGRPRPAGTDDRASARASRAMVFELPPSTPSSSRFVRHASRRPEYARGGRRRARRRSSPPCPARARAGWRRVRAHRRCAVPDQAASAASAWYSASISISPAGDGQRRGRPALDPALR